LGETNKLKTMKVKIVKAKDTWYLHRVGETFEVNRLTRIINIK